MPDTEPSPAATIRGTRSFQITPSGDLLNSATNVRLLGQLWADRAVIRGDDLGPGDPGDFDHGAWHSSCHLLGAGGVRQAVDGRVMWLDVVHARSRDEYYAAATLRDGTGVRTVPLDTAEGRMLVAGSTLLGFVEGSSLGRISARNVFDGHDTFNLWRRQDFDQPVGSTLEGGKVWEHWCTLRDLRPTCRLAWSVIAAYVSLTAALGDRFCAAVARGRRSYGHPAQLTALVQAGFVSIESATWDTQPLALPAAAERLFQEAEPESSLAAAEQLIWDTAPVYYMFARQIQSWSTAKDVKADLKGTPS